MQENLRESMDILKEKYVLTYWSYIKNNIYGKR